MFNWDGTDVSDIINTSEIFEAKYNKRTYWVIREPNPESKPESNPTEETCLVRSCKTNLPCIIDELKPIFGLQKLGTHWCKYKGKVKQLIKCVRGTEGYVTEEITLNQINDISPLLILQVQEIFTFRELLGITCSYDSSIIVRQTKNGMYPISFYEPNMVMENSKVIPFTVLDKWFENSSIDDVVKRLFKINDINRLDKLLQQVRNSIEITIERVDRSAISYKTSIMNRITQRLQTSLN